MPDKRKKSRVVHVELLKKWYSRDDEHQAAKWMFITGVVTEIGQTANADCDGHLGWNEASNIVETELYSDANMATGRNCARTFG